MGMHVFSLLKIKHTLRRNLRDKSRDADWDFGARQSPPDATDTGSGARRDDDDATAHARRRRSASADGQRLDVQAPIVGHEHGEHKRVSASVGAGNVSLNGNTRGPRGDTDDARLNGPRSGTPEGDVLLAAGESAKELRTAAKPADQRRRIQPTAAATATAARLPDATSVPLPSSPTSVRSFANSPTPSMQSLQSVRSGRSDGSTSGRASILAGKRSMPQLHNVWENFLEEAAEDVNSFTFPMPPHSPGKFATVHVSSRSSTSIDGNQSLRQHHHHTPTSSSSSASTATTTASVSTVKTLPRNPLPEPPPQPQATTRSRGHLRASHHTSSSTSSTTASITGSTSSMAAFSSASSMTTMHDDCDDGSQTFCDDPVPAIPRSSAAISPKSFRFADPKSSGPPPVVQQRLRKSPTTPALLHYQSLPRGPSPSSSTSSESQHSTTPSFFHSQSSTPTPSSVCPTPSPTSHAPSPTSPSKRVDRVGPVLSKNSGPYRRAPESELPEQPLYPGSLKGRKSLSNFYRHSAAVGGSRIELGFSPSLDTQDEGGDWDEDVLSELGYYGPTSSRAKSRERRQSALSSLSLSQPSSTNSSSELSFIPPQRRSSRQLLSIAGAQSAPPGESMLLPRAKSVSNIKHEANASLPKRPQMMVSHSSQPVLATNGASSDASRYPHGARLGPVPLPTRSLLRARSQTLEQAPAQTARNESAAVSASSSAVASVPHLPSSASASKSSQGRLRSGSSTSSAAPSPSAAASTAHYHTHSRPVPQGDAKAPPVRPPPAPPLDMGPTTTTMRHPTMVGTRGSTTSSPLTPSSAVQWGYAL